MTAATMASTSTTAAKAIAMPAAPSSAPLVPREVLGADLHRDDAGHHAEHPEAGDDRRHDHERHEGERQGLAPGALGRAHGGEHLAGRALGAAGCGSPASAGIRGCAAPSSPAGRRPGTRGLPDGAAAIA